MTMRIGAIALCLLFVLSGCQVAESPPAISSATATSAPPTTEPATLAPTTEVAPTTVSDVHTVISGRALWGSTPVVDALVTLRTGAWADANNSQVIAQAISAADGSFELEAPPAGGEFGLAAQWPDGGVNAAPVTPVRVSGGATLPNVDVYLAKELPLIEPISGAEVSATPTLRWGGVPDVAAYKLWIADAGTTEVVFDLTITEVSETMELIAPPLTPDRTYTWAVSGLAVANDDTSAANLLAGLSSEFRVGSVGASDYPPAPAERVPGYIAAADPGTATYQNDEGGFSLELPGDWVVRDGIPARVGSLYAAAPAALIDFAESNFAIFDAASVSLEQALAEQCLGSERPPEEITLASGVTVQHVACYADGGDIPRDDWYAVSHAGKLILLRIKDPATREDLVDVVNTLRLDE